MTCETKTLDSVSTFPIQIRFFFLLSTPFSMWKRRKVETYVICFAKTQDASNSLINNNIIFFQSLLAALLPTLGFLSFCVVGRQYKS